MDTVSVNLQPIDAAIAIFGSQGALAKAAGVSDATISKGIRNGFSLKLAFAIEGATGGRVRASQLKPKTRKKRSTEEEQLQIRVWNAFERRRRTGVIGFHVPNGGKRGKLEAIRFKEMGVVSGVPDLVFTRVDGKTVYLELKARSGKMSEEQEIFRARILQTQAIWGIANNDDDALGFLILHDIIT